MFTSDNEIDGEAFLLLSDEQIKSIVKPIGSQMKLISKKKSIERLMTMMLWKWKVYMLLLHLVLKW